MPDQNPYGKMMEYPEVPPATRSLPSGRKQWPAQNRSRCSLGTLTVSIRSVAGSHVRVAMLFRGNFLLSFPEPEKKRTFPVWRRAAWTGRISELYSRSTHSSPPCAAPELPMTSGNNQFTLARVHPLDDPGHIGDLLRIDLGVTGPSSSFSRLERSEAFPSGVVEALKVRPRER